MGAASTPSRRRVTLLGCVAAAVIGFGTSGACSVSSTGLGPVPDGAAGTGGSIACPSGLTDQASWPAKTTTTACTRPCGPDEVGLQVCTQIDLPSCQAKPGCVCVQGPCVACAACALPLNVSDCYVPANGGTASACAVGVGRGNACSPPCGRHLCLQADGKSACLCNSAGTYACARWSGTSWQ